MNQKSITSVTLILVGNMLTTYNNIGSGWTSTITAIIGFIIFFIGLGQLKSFLDEQGQKGIRLLTISAILGIVALIIHFIPLIGGVFAGILYMAAFVLQLVGLLQLKKSEKLGSQGVNGVNNLLIAMVLMIIGSLISILPFAGETIDSVICLVALLLILFGWLNIQKGIVEKEVTSN